MDTLLGKTLGQYQVQEVIGRGGMATVYRAYQPSLNRSVAIKVLPPLWATDPDFVGRFRHEARAIARLQHPNILPVYDFGEEDGLLYIVMMLVTGGTLRDRLVGGPLDLQTALLLSCRLADALDYAHQQGVIHRDIKPSNILLARPDWPLLADFGIARLVESETQFTRPGTGLGTPQYMSPEQALGHPVDHRSDIYALGVILYQLLTGRVPFEGDTPVSIIHRHVYEQPPLPSALRPEVPAALEAVVLKALAKEPAQRYQTAGELKAALEQVQTASAPAGITRTFLPGGEPVGPGPTGPGGQRWRWVIGGAIMALSVIVAGSFLLLTRPFVGRPEPRAPAVTTETTGRISVAPGQVIFEDDFSNPLKGGWTGDRDKVYIQDGQLHVLAKTTGQFYRTWPANAPAIDNFSLEAEITQLSGGTDAYGVFFRDKGSKNFYLFWIHSDGLFGLSKSVSGPSGNRFEQIFPPRSSPAVNHGDNVTNRLQVEASGTHLALSINGQLVAEVDDDFSSRGTFGIYTENTLGIELHVAVSRIKVTQR